MHPLSTPLYHHGVVRNKAQDQVNIQMRIALFWAITQRVVITAVPMFRDNLSVPSSGVKILGRR